ncbi:hypothetical protein F5144DRAFT_642115 [Chaetomium tenue]|uniref:Uncharacterized protein n=1 Tax=Chaetomium tenue TaxID=1854479 RepID=A0ACB7PGY3_9PEZI|nr:hypothetical protein F5144DRAFT_642115 [Chaetomium globosum]
MADVFGLSVDPQALLGLPGCHESHKSRAELPNGFPATLVSPLADVAEISTAIAGFKKSEPELYQLSPETFPLPGLVERFAAYKSCLHEGPGFFTIRGLTPGKRDARENVIVHAGIASYLATSGRCSSIFPGRKLMRSDVSNIREDPFLAPGNQSIGVGFHSDNGDNVSLYCRQVATSGGDLYLSSTWTIYNELATHRKDVVRVLAEPWLSQISRLGDDDLKSKNVPLFNFHDGKLVVDYQKRPLRGTKEEPRDPRLKLLTFQQQEALSVVDKLAFENAISVDQQVGDINFFNNLALLHARSPFVDGEDGQVRRHLTRLIFRDEAEGWSIPEHMKADWAKYYEHDSSAETFREEPCRWAWSLNGQD